MTRIQIFHETMETFSSDPFLNAQTEKACKSTRVYEPGFVSGISPEAGKDSRICFMSATTLQAAEEAARNGERTAILNFANPANPGGGVTYGARAQEEDICRASNLYRCLTHENASAYYAAHAYEYQHSSEGWLRSSDRVIYTEGCIVIRRDVCDGNGVWDSQQLENHYAINVLTCAAPAFFDDYLPEVEHEYRTIMQNRIKNILEVAIEHRTETLILGAFGCGAFHNPPEIVAEIFHDILTAKRYQNAFRRVVFAVRPGRYAHDINTVVFKKYFG